ncbi:MAG: hypothetical protein ACPGUC_08225 [Gammaproteobacteria bacterium]
MNNIHRQVDNHHGITPDRGPKVGVGLLAAATATALMYDPSAVSTELISPLPEPA